MIRFQALEVSLSIVSTFAKFAALLFKSEIPFLGRFPKTYSVK